LVALICAGTQFSTASAQDGAKKPETKVLIAVMDFVPVGATKGEALAITDRLGEELFQSGKFTLIDRSQMDSILKEQAFQQTGCTSQECAVHAGQVLGVRNLVTGRVTKLGDELWLMSSTMVDVETSETLRAVTVRFRGDLGSLLDAPVAQLGAKLVGLPPPAAAAPVAVTAAVPVAAAPVAATAAVPVAAAPVITPVAAAAPVSARAEPGKPHQLALFPIRYRNLNGESISEPIAQAIYGAALATNWKVAYSAYQVVTGGTSLSGANNLKDALWQADGEPNTTTLKDLSLLLGVDDFLMVTASMRGSNGSTAVYLYDVPQSKMYTAEHSNTVETLVEIAGQSAKETMLAAAR
jgi:hypothetical protein